MLGGRGCRRMSVRGRVHGVVSGRRGVVRRDGLGDDDLRGRDGVAGHDDARLVRGGLGSWPAAPPQQQDKAYDKAHHGQEAEQAAGLGAHPCVRIGSAPAGMPFKWFPHHAAAHQSHGGITVAAVLRPTSAPPKRAAPHAPTRRLFCLPFFTRRSFAPPACRPAHNVPPKALPGCSDDTGRG